jgi:hypothetical protein
VIRNPAVVFVKTVLVVSVRPLLQLLAEPGPGPSAPGAELVRHG